MIISFPGPLTEIKLPVDQLTKKLKGFAFVTYMIPEHAVKAYSDLDGKVFQVSFIIGFKYSRTQFLVILDIVNNCIAKTWLH